MRIWKLECWEFGRPVATFSHHWTARVQGRTDLFKRAPTRKMALDGLKTLIKQQNPEAKFFVVRDLPRQLADLSRFQKKAS